ncbi:MAG TPA: hypothetical protein VKU02_24330 [Gemmataceae bacterium]|nr:hypothetical protein [Gemmataceae bacterium]
MNDARNTAAAADLTSSLNAQTLQVITPGRDITTMGQAGHFTAAAPASTSGTLTVSVQSSGEGLLSPLVNVYSAGQALHVAASGRNANSPTVVRINTATGQRWKTIGQNIEDDVGTTPVRQSK